MGYTNYLAVDLGATSGRTILASFDGRRVEMKELTRFANPIVPVGGHLYWDIVALYNEVLNGLRVVADHGVEIKSVGIDTWGCDFAFFGSDGQLLGMPHSYRDRHTAGAQKEFFKKMPATELYHRTGIQFMDFNSLFQLDTMKRNGCQALEHAEKILFIPDALIYMLTGKIVCEYTVASTSQMLNPHTGDLDHEILSVLGISRDKFGDMLQPGSVAGILSRQVQEATGLGKIPVVAVAGHDTGSAVAAVPTDTPYYAYLSCGTWSLMGVESKNAIINEVSFKENFTNEGGIEGTTRFLKNICGLWLLEQSRKEFKDAPSSVSELVALCEKSTYNGLIFSDDSSFTAPVSMISAIDRYCKATSQELPQTTADYCRCIFRSLALRYRQVLDNLKNMCGFPIRQLNVMGGGSQNKYLMQYTANALNMPVVCGPVEGTALGNVLMQMKASGIVDSLDEMRKISVDSVDLITYMPQDNDEWEKAFAEFIAITK